MSREAYALYAGIFILVLGAAMLGIASYLSDYGEEREIYLVVTRGSVAGLNPESTVVFRGVPAGKVSAIRFDPEEPGNILVRLELEPGLPVTKGTYAMLRVQALTGLAQVELSDSGENPEPLKGDAANPPRLQLHPSLFEKLTDSAQQLLPQVTELAARLSAMADEKNRAHLESVLGNLDRLSQDLLALTRHLDETLTGLPELREQTRRALDEMSRLSRDLTRTSEHIRAVALSTEGLVSSGKTGLDTLARSTLPKADALLAELQRVAASMMRLSRQLETDPQLLLLGRRPPPPGPGEPGYGEPR